MSRVAYILIWIFVFSVPWQAVVMIPGVGTISKLMGMVAFGVGILTVVTGARFRPPALFHVVALLFVAWGSLSLFWTLDQDVTKEWIFNSMQVLVAAWLIWELGSTPERHEGLMRAYVFGAWVAALNTIGNYSAGTLAKQSSQSMQRFAATGFNPNDLGFLLAIALPMAWYFGVQEPRWWMRWANRLYLPFGLMAIILTGSRGALIAAIVGCGLILPWTLPQTPRRTRAVVVVLLLLSAIAVVRYAPTTSLERLATTRTEVMEGTLNNRKMIWAAALGVVPRSPMLGVGAGTFKQAVLPVLGFEKTAHNTFLEILVETGIVGLVLFLAMLTAGFYRALRAPRRVRPLLLTVLFTLGVGLMPRAASIEKTTWVLLAFLIYPAVTVVAAVPAARPVLRPGRLRQPVGAVRTVTTE